MERTHIYNIGIRLKSNALYDGYEKDVGKEFKYLSDLFKTKLKKEMGNHTGGVDLKIIGVKLLGEKRPIKGEANELERLQNFLVEIRLYHADPHSRDKQSLRNIEFEMTAAMRLFRDRLFETCLQCGYSFLRVKELNEVAPKVEEGEEEAAIEEQKEIAKHIENLKGSI